MTRRIASQTAEIDFQPHVPQAVRDVILDEVGIPGGTDRWALASLLATAVHDIKEMRDGSGLEAVKSLAEDLQEAEKYKAELQRQIDDYRKLATSEAMREAYAHLMGKFTTKAEWSSFLRSAVGAHKDYRLERQRLSVAKALQSKIVSQCEELLHLITKYQTLSDRYIRGPREFSQIPSLQWCPSLEWQEVWHDEAESAQPARFWRFTPKLDKTAPAEPAMTAEVLERLIDAGLNFEVGPIANYVAAATSSNKSNPNIEYVRAFCSLLHGSAPLRKHKLSGFFKPVAITATVILDVPEVVLSYDDLRKAVGMQRTGAEDLSVRGSAKSSSNRARSRREKT